MIVLRRLVAAARHPPAAVHPSTDWLEVFYDLVFVSAVFVFSNALSTSPNVADAAIVMGGFAALWWVWLETTSFAGSFAVAEGARRALVLAQMLPILLVALAIADDGGPHPVLVSVGFALLLLDLGLGHGLAARAVPEYAAFARHRSAAYLVAAALVAAAAAAPDPARIALWTLAAAVAVVPSLAYRFGRRPGEPPFDEGHLVERTGLLTIIVLGEAFLKISIAAGENSLERIDLVTVAFLFVLLVAIWWTYFGDVPLAGVPTQGGRRRAWVLGHLALHLSLVLLVVGVGRCLPLDIGKEVADETVLLLVGPLAGVYVSLAAILACSRRRPLSTLVAVRAGAAMLAVGIGLAAWLVPRSVEFEAVIGMLAAIAAVEAITDAQARRSTRTRPASSASGLPGLDSNQ